MRAGGSWEYKWRFWLTQRWIFHLDDVKYDFQKKLESDWNQETSALKETSAALWLLGDPLKCAQHALMLHLVVHICANVLEMMMMMRSQTKQPRWPLLEPGILQIKRSRTQQHFKFFFFFLWLCSQAKAGEDESRLRLATGFCPAGPTLDAAPPRTVLTYTLPFMAQRAPVDFLGQDQEARLVSGLVSFCNSRTLCVLQAEPREQSQKEMCLVVSQGE